MIATVRHAMPRPPKRNDLAVKVDAELVRMAKIISAVKGVTIAQVLSDAARPTLEKEMGKVRDQFPGKKP